MGYSAGWLDGISDTGHLFFSLIRAFKGIAHTSTKHELGTNTAVRETPALRGGGDGGSGGDGYVDGGGARPRDLRLALQLPL